jgi:hypothetical protein
MATKLVDQATLIRGETYTLRHPKSTPVAPLESLRFTRNEPKTIEDKDLLDMLEDLVEDSYDSDGELYEKPLFRIERGVRIDIDTSPRARRLEASREVRTTIRKRPMKKRR